MARFNGNYNFGQMADGTIAYGPGFVLEMLNNSIMNQMRLDASAKFTPGTIVEVTASIEQLTSYFLNSGERPMEARNHAYIILGNKTGEVISAHDFDEGRFYTVEFETEPMCILPEKFLR